MHSLPTGLGETAAVKDQFGRVREVFFEAIEYEEPGARQAFVESCCAGDADMILALRELLEAHDETEGFLREGADSQPAIGDHTDRKSAETALPTRTGQTIGPYRVRERIGEGGMGTVYVAEQSQPVRRKVALKVIKLGMATNDVIARFEAERQAVAMMHHPNIASIFDAGVTDDGQPYFVMELVRGVPITEYCDQYLLTVEDRLRLFANVCMAVQHAHLKGIIHRDLKPSNILVTRVDGAGVPKIIDFGIAKATRDRLSARSIYTKFTQMMGTPPYMSPEQVEMSGIDVDTRSDVYSLGVILYQLLTGRTPFCPDSLARASQDEIVRTICSFEPARPSKMVQTLQAEMISTVVQQRSTDLRRLESKLRGELDWVVMKALEKDRDRRYESASAVAADIERYLNDEPVAACPPSRWYRLHKIAKRHRWKLATGVLILATMSVATSVAISYAMKATSAERLADQRLRRSQRDLARTLTTLDTVVGELTSLYGSQSATRESRDEKMQRVWMLYDEILSEDDARSSDTVATLPIANVRQSKAPANPDPTEIVGKASAWPLVILSRELSARGDYKNALRAAQIHRQRVDSVWMTDVANCEAQLGLREYDQALAAIEIAIDAAPRREFWLFKRRAEALFGLGEWRLALDDLQRVVENNPDDLSTLTWLGTANIALQRDPNFYRAIHRLANRSVVLNHDSMEARVARAIIMWAVGDTDSALGELDRVIQGAETTNVRDRSSILRALCLSTLIDSATGDTEAYRSGCSQILNQIVHSSDSYDQDLVLSTCTLAPDAVGEYDRLIELARAVITQQPNDASVRRYLGMVLYRAGRYEEAEIELKACVFASSDLASRTGGCRYFLSMAHYKCGNVRAAHDALALANQARQHLLKERQPSWRRLKEMELLHQEAETLIGGGTHHDDRVD